jgi:hypothetical protein
MNDYERIKQAYADITRIIDQHDDLCDGLRYAKDSMKAHLWGLELKHTYNLPINPKNVTSTDFVRIGEYADVAGWGDGLRAISWSDNGEQPDNELLVRISFPSGAYVFTRQLATEYPLPYPKEVFRRFFDELKSYGAKYVDTANSCLYFTLDNASEVLNKLDATFKTYQEIATVFLKQEKIDKLQRELEELTKP